MSTRARAAVSERHATSPPAGPPRTHAQATQAAPVAPERRTLHFCSCAGSLVVVIMSVAMGMFSREVLRPARPWIENDSVATPEVNSNGLSGVLGQFVELFPEGGIRDSLTEYARSLPTLSNFEPSVNALGVAGQRAAEQGLTSKHPVIFVPGFITSGLELWKGTACAGSQFRRRMWGTLEMLHMVTTAKDCWLRHMDLDGETGGDPPGIRVRAAQSFDAADYFAGPFWVWAPVLESLAHIGYSASELYFAAYDWRLPFHALESRDHFFSLLKANIEIRVRSTQEKAMIVAHSMGCNVLAYFLKWVSHPAPEGGGAPASWVEEHIESIALIGGPQLGTSSALVGLLAGDAEGFTVVPGALGMTLNNIVSPAIRRRIMRAFGSSQSLLPMGGNAVWGDLTSAPDDEAPDEEGAADEGGRPPHGLSRGAWLGKRDETENGDAFRAYWTVEDATSSLRDEATRSRDQRWADRGKPFTFWEQQREWTNPLITPLPHAPSLKIACLYGVGLPTERAYVASEALARAQPPEEGLRAGDAVPWLIDRTATNGTTLVRGVRTSDGDGTVNLVSLGYTCYSPWRKRKDLNPAGAHIVQREYAHEGASSISTLRSGPGTAQHVDILGNHALLADLLTMAAGRTLELEDRIVSAIPRIADAIDPRVAVAERSSL